MAIGDGADGSDNNLGGEVKQQNSLYAGMEEFRPPVSEFEKQFTGAFSSLAQGDVTPLAQLLLNNPNIDTQRIKDMFSGVSVTKDSDGIRLTMNDKDYPSIQRTMKFSNGKMTPEVVGDNQSLDYVDFVRKLPKMPNGRTVDFTGWEKPFAGALKK